MVRVITQQTYDEVVAENIAEFSMSPQEAINDAIAQFEAQGVDLSNIINDLALCDSKDAHLVSKIVASLNSLLNAKHKDLEKIKEELKRLKVECDKGLPHRVMAANEGAYSIILKAISVNEEALLESAVQTLIALMNGNPDHLDQVGVDLIIKTLSKECSEATEITMLRWASVCCEKHEMNRQNIFNAGILTILRRVLFGNNNLSLLREACTLIRNLVLDDDIRVEFGMAHVHARSIATDTLTKLTSLLKDFKSNDTFVGELLLTLSSLLVRHEFCQMVEESGGLQFILDVLVEFHNNDKLIKQLFILLKALAGNDEVKKNIIKGGAAPLITSCLDHHKASESTVVVGLACVAAISLREQANGRELFDSGIAEVIVQCMKMYPESIKVQKNASRAIRNMVSRNKNQSEKYLELGAEELLNGGLARFEKECGFDLKSALRDLGCRVQFDEQWTGKGGMLQTSTADDAY